MATPTPDERISECGKAMAIAAVPLYTHDGTVHPPTLLAACARMAGFYLLRSAHVVTVTMEPGQAILSPEVSERSPVLLRTCAAVLGSLGNVLPAAPPQPLIDASTSSRESFLETQACLSPVFAPLQARFALDDYQAARAAAVATAVTAHTVRTHLDMPRAFGVAAFAFTEGSRTVPLPDGNA
jgi:hypothetical protein